MGNKTRQKDGQAIIEYVLLLAIIISMAGGIMLAVRKNRDKLWKMMICEISAGCPGCKSTESAKAYFKNSKINCKR